MSRKILCKRFCKRLKKLETFALRVNTPKTFSIISIYWLNAKIKISLYTAMLHTILISLHFEGVKLIRWLKARFRINVFMLALTLFPQKGRRFRNYCLFLFTLAYISRILCIFATLSICK